MGYHVIHDVAETAGARPHDLFLVEADDLRHWADVAIAEERRALRRLVEEKMRLALVDGIDPACAMAEIVAGLEERG
jgi:hypothetical protein